MKNTASTATTLSAFTSLKGGMNSAIAPGARLVTLSTDYATWWEHDEPVNVSLPRVTEDGSRWVDDHQLRVGLGTLDLVAKKWHADATLQHWNRRGPQGQSPVARTAWFPDTEHVAILLRNYQLQQERGKPNPQRWSNELVIVARSDGRVRGRMMVPHADSIATSHNRVLLHGQDDELLLLDLEAKLIATLPVSALRIREGAGMFAAISAKDEIVAISPLNGAIIAKWKLPTDIADVVPVSSGLLAIDYAGLIYVGCLQRSVINLVGKFDSKMQVPVMQVVGEQLAVAGSVSGETTVVRVATFTNPCQ